MDSTNLTATTTTTTTSLQSLQNHTLLVVTTITTINAAVAAVTEKTNTNVLMKVLNYSTSNYKGATYDDGIIYTNIDYVGNSAYDDDDDGDGGDSGGVNSRNYGIKRDEGSGAGIVGITTTYYGKNFDTGLNEIGAFNTKTYSHSINTNVNLLLGGAMLSLMTTILCVVCYCCHRSIKKRTEAAYRQQQLQHQQQQQQNLWLENDSNVEVYSVEQCYESSRLYLSESANGIIANVPTLQHEPPPSYDAVVAMQERQQLLMQRQQQQQQLLSEHIMPQASPPPGYRSTLDIRHLSNVATPIITTTIFNAEPCTSSNPAATTANDLGDNASESSCRPHYQQHRYCHEQILNTNQLHKQNKALATHTNAVAAVNIKNVLNAQSCCSLQRAEVENMWHAAAAALVNRERPSSNNSPKLSTNHMPRIYYNTMHHHKIQVTTTPETFGSRYLKQTNYRRGCPLCGKFRYDNDTTLSLSKASSVENLACINYNDSGNDNGAGVAKRALVGPAINKIKKQNSNGNAGANEEQHSEQMEDTEEEDDEEEVEQQERCACTNSLNNHFNQPQKPHSNYNLIATGVQIACGNSSNNNNNGNQPPAARLCANKNLNNNNNELIEEDNTNNNNNNSGILTLTQTTNPVKEIDSNANISRNQYERQTTYTITTTTTTTTTTTSTITTAPINTTLNLSTNCSAAHHQATTIAHTNTLSAVNLDCINENGIISLDMSKIIDNTGLPTYDAALKLESSGYV